MSTRKIRYLKRKLREAQAELRGAALPTIDQQEDLFVIVEEALAETSFLFTKRQGSNDVYFVAKIPPLHANSPGLAVREVVDVVENALLEADLSCFSSVTNRGLGNGRTSGKMIECRDGGRIDFTVFHGLRPLIVVEVIY